MLQRSRTKIQLHWYWIGNRGSVSLYRFSQLASLPRWSHPSVKSRLSFARLKTYQESDERMEALKRDRDDVADLCSTPTLGRGATQRVDRRDYHRRSVEERSIV